MFPQRRQAPQKAGPADLRLAAVPGDAVQHSLRTIPRKPVSQRYDHVHADLPHESKFEAPSWVSHDFVPRAMPKAPAQAPELRERGKEAGQLRSLFSSVYNRNKKGKSKLDKASISAPINIYAPPRVSNFRAPTGTMPRRPGRTDGFTSVPTSSRAQANPVSEAKPLPPVPSEWKTSNPVRLSPAPREDADMEDQAYARWSIGNWSLVADDGDQEPRVADWSSDEEGEEEEYVDDLDSACGDDELRRASTEVVVDGDAIENWQLSRGNVYLSFPEPGFEEKEEGNSTKQQRRRGIIFSSSETVQLPDEAYVDDEVKEEEDDDLEGPASSEEPSVFDASFQSPEQEHSVDNEDSSSAPHLQLVEIKVTPPTPTRGRADSLVHNEYLTPADAYKRIAEKYRKEAKRSREEADLVLYHCKPLMQAFEIIKNDPEFSHLDSWEGAFEVLEMILQERKYNKIAREQARSSAIWFRELYEKMLSEQVRLVSIYGTSEDFVFTTLSSSASSEGHAERSVEREHTRGGEYWHFD
ncbi:hypothetical protein PFICI_05696 [Pestalotiopsis fici W106-1]|uniref:Uncharacterized protein n=1 Tax=Pestalotiopsis fici (strain W106-1 / CGMCC3.15140) TaxID=1229662 RepID=W3XCN5_PESFW|nr:uncharacterized protein PFICI_05696 [Pestalotiopsis fici W106-1]ETS83820.1 hypothetical protein PFICI_05696 [Pestalotiopsis fici W106-1]